MVVHDNDFKGCRENLEIFLEETVFGFDVSKPTTKRASIRVEIGEKSVV